VSFGAARLAPGSAGLVLFVAWAFCFAAPTPAQQQGEDEVPPPPVEDIEEPVIEDLPPGPEGDLIEEILSRGEAALESGQVYDPANRRDPFRSLVRVIEQVRQTGPRPEGLAGLLIDEVSITGIWQTQNGPVAQVQSSHDPRSFLLRPGDRVFDGEVLAVRYVRGEGGEVVFRQVVQDPDSPRPFREVVKRLKP
jgi:hypothetical protein